MKASLGAHAVARESFNPISIAVARSIGQAIATAHMADHSLGAAFYALKAVKHASKSTDEERERAVCKSCTRPICYHVQRAIFRMFILIFAHSRRSEEIDSNQKCP